MLTLSLKKTQKNPRKIAAELARTTLKNQQFKIVQLLIERDLLEESSIKMSKSSLSNRINKCLNKYRVAFLSERQRYMEVYGKETRSRKHELPQNIARNPLIKER